MKVAKICIRNEDLQLLGNYIPANQLIKGRNKGTHTVFTLTETELTDWMTLIPHNMLTQSLREFLQHAGHNVFNWSPRVPYF